MSTPVSSDPGPVSRRGWSPLVLAVFGGVTLATFGILALLVTIFEHKQEAQTPFVRLVDVTEISTDPQPWGMNWPSQFDGYRRSVDDSEVDYGGSSAMPESKLETSPWLRRLYAGYAFSIDYREARGHAYMLHDQEVTERVTKRPQTGACLHCHASIIPTYRRIGLEALSKPADAAALAADFNWPAVLKGFETLGTRDYASAHAELLKTPDGTSETKSAGGDAGHPQFDAHPVSCIDCHDPKSMEIRVTRPGFIKGIAALAEGEAPVPHLPSVSRWRKGNREKPYDPNVDANRQELRSFVCGQCHVEYYCASRETLFFPWNNGLQVDQIETTYEAHKFPDGEKFYDFKHGETGALSYKAQHPEFELWSQGIHARSGVSCADCHMPYERMGAMKVSNHHVRSPLNSVNRSCQVCHHFSEDDLRNRVKTIQEKTTALLERSAAAMTGMLDAIREAQAAGATADELEPILTLQRKATWRIDFISSENSGGFHADQEAARILGEAIDYCRQAEVAALRLRAPPAPKVDKEKIVPIEGVTPTKRPEEKP